MKNLKIKRIDPCREILQIDATEFEGRIFYSTDIHGHFDLLHEKFREVGFDSEKDILILGGDCTDRGPDSKYVLDYLDEPWIYSVRGNHEEMVISYIESISPDYPEGERQPFEMLYFNGGAWFFDLTVAQEMRIYETFKSLPLAIELITRKETIGIIHAQCPYNNWNEFKKMTNPELEFNGYATAQWARTNYDRQWQQTVKGVDRLLVGHSPTDSGEVEILGNTWYSDLGSFFRNKISFLEISSC